MPLHRRVPLFHLARTRQNESRLIIGPDCRHGYAAKIGGRLPPTTAGGMCQWDMQTLDVGLSTYAQLRGGDAVGSEVDVLPKMNSGNQTQLRYPPFSAP